MFPQRKVCPNKNQLEFAMHKTAHTGSSQNHPLFKLASKEDSVYLKITLCFPEIIVICRTTILVYPKKKQVASKNNSLAQKKGN